MSIGSATNQHIHAHWYGNLLTTPCILVCLDKDAAGVEAAQHLATISQVVRLVPIPVEERPQRVLSPHWSRQHVGLVIAHPRCPKPIRRRAKQVRFAPTQVQCILMANQSRADQLPEPDSTDTGSGVLSANKSAVITALLNASRIARAAPMVFS